MDTACIFRWHPHSILYNKDRPRRLAAFVEVDSLVLLLYYKIRVNHITAVQKVMIKTLWQRKFVF